MNVNQNDLRKRVIKFREELNLPIVSFCKNVDIERSTYYKWIRQYFDFGEERAKRIDEYLKRFGF